MAVYTFWKRWSVFSARREKKYFLPFFVSIDLTLIMATISTSDTKKKIMVVINKNEKKLFLKSGKTSESIDGDLFAELLNGAINEALDGYGWILDKWLIKEDHFTKVGSELSF